MYTRIVNPIIITIKPQDVTSISVLMREHGDEHLGGDMLELCFENDPVLLRVMARKFTQAAKNFEQEVTKLAKAARKRQSKRKAAV